jgi:hypothetical protein
LIKIKKITEKERPRNFRKKQAKLNFLRGGTTADFATEKMDDSYVDKDKCFLLSLLSYFRQFNDEQKFLARIEILKLYDTSNCNKIWILTHLAPCLHFQTQCPSNLITFCNQFTKPTTSNFSAGFRNSLPVLIQLLSPASKATSLHNCPPLVSYNSLSYLQ